MDLMTVVTTRNVENAPLNVKQLLKLLKKAKKNVLVSVQSEKPPSRWVRSIAFIEYREKDKIWTELKLLGFNMKEVTNEVNYQMED